MQSGQQGSIPVWLSMTLIFGSQTIARTISRARLLSGGPDKSEWPSPGPRLRYFKVSGPQNVTEQHMKRGMRHCSPREKAEENRSDLRPRASIQFGRPPGTT